MHGTCFVKSLTYQSTQERNDSEEQLGDEDVSEFFPGETSLLWFIVLKFLKGSQAFCFREAKVFPPAHECWSSAADAYPRVVRCSGLLKPTSRG